MLLALDVGNTQIFAGVFEGDKIQLRFRKTSKTACSSDEYGLFLRQVLRENAIDPTKITQIVMSSVVPDVNHSLASACIKYFNVRPLILQAGVKTGIKIRTVNPQEVGADLVAGAVAATHLYPDENLLVVDFGTANTLAVINAKREYLGVSIVPGLRLAMESLQHGTAKLPTVELKIPEMVYGRTTAEAIQSGLYYQAVGMIKAVVAGLLAGEFKDQSVRVIGTGGLAGLLHSAGAFDSYEPDLILIGLKVVFDMNQESHA